jgi:hypothetical protein
LEVVKFKKLNKNKNTFSIRGQFESVELLPFRTAFRREIDHVNELSERTTSNKRELDPDISYTLSFNATDQLDDKLPLMAGLRNWWGADEVESQTWVLTQKIGGTSTLHTDELYDQTRYIIFLSKWEPGQWWWFDGEETYTGWDVGTVVDYDFTRPHATANASHSQRTLMQITHKLK